MNSLIIGINSRRNQNQESQPEYDGEENSKKRYKQKKTIQISVISNN